MFLDRGVQLVESDADEGHSAHAGRHDGCSDGRCHLSTGIAKHGAQRTFQNSHVVALDVSPHHVEYAHRRAQVAHVVDSVVQGLGFEVEQGFYFWDGTKVELSMRKLVEVLGKKEIRIRYVDSEYRPYRNIFISDDINLDIGRMRIRKQGSAGGHNGLKNIIAHLKTEDFTRVRIGVGENGGSTELIKHVLGKFNKADRAKIDRVVREAADSVEFIITDGEEAAMNKYNS